MPCLVLQVRDKLQRFELTDGAILGRGDDAQVCIVDPTISRHHARFTLSPDALPSVEDLNSANGVRVDGDRIYPRDVLPDGAQVRFGDIAGWVFHKEPPFRLETGPMCAVCQWVVEPRQPMHRCNDCGVLYHRDCWTQNGGCGSYGCSQVGAAVLADSGDHAADSETAGLDLVVSRSTSSTDAALLAAAVAASVVGVLAFGLPAALVAAFAGFKRFIPAAALAGVGAVVGVAVSWWWWLAEV